MPSNSGQFSSKCTRFQPICGNGKPVSGISSVCPFIKPRVETLPSVENSVISCMPKQMPSTGCVRFWITSIKPKCCKFNIAALAVPTPGKINLSADLILLRSLVISALYPNRSKANLTEERLAHWVSMMVMLIILSILCFK